MAGLIQETVVEEHEMQEEANTTSKKRPCPTLADSEVEEPAYKRTRPEPNEEKEVFVRRIGIRILMKDNTGNGLVVSRHVIRHAVKKDLLITVHQCSLDDLPPFEFVMSTEKTADLFMEQFAEATKTPE